MQGGFASGRPVAARGVLLNPGAICCQIVERQSLIGTLKWLVLQHFVKAALDPLTVVVEPVAIHIHAAETRPHECLEQLVYRLRRRLPQPRVALPAPDRAVAPAQMIAV